MSKKLNDKLNNKEINEEKIDNAVHTNCNYCQFINITEEYQQIVNCKFYHTCLKYKRRLGHKNKFEIEPEIRKGDTNKVVYPCSECLMDSGVISRKNYNDVLL